MLKNVDFIYCKDSF